MYYLLGKTTTIYQSVGVQEVREFGLKRDVVALHLFWSYLRMAIEQRDRRTKAVLFLKPKII